MWIFYKIDSAWMISDGLNQQQFLMFAFQWQYKEMGELALTIGFQIRNEETKSSKILTKIWEELEWALDQNHQHICQSPSPVDTF